MPFRRSRMSTIKSDKHEITWSNLGQDASTPQTVLLAQGVASANKNISNEVEIGAHIKTVYLEFHFSAAQTANANVIHWELVMERANQTLTGPNLYYQADRAQIMKRGMEMLPTNVSTVFKRIIVLRVPKIYQRMRDEMKLEFKYTASSAQTINACGFAIYKEFY